MQHKYFSYSFCSPFPRPLPEQTLHNTVSACLHVHVFKKRVRERQGEKGGGGECLPIFVHLCVLQTATETQTHGSPTECLCGWNTGKLAGLVFFREVKKKKHTRDSGVDFRCRRVRRDPKSLLSGFTAASSNISSAKSSESYFFFFA